VSASTPQVTAEQRFTDDRFANHHTAECQMANDILSLVSEKWSMFVVMVLTSRSRRFSDIRRSLPGISQRMLTRSLRCLERDGFVTRTVTPTKPPRVDYELTALGFSLQESLAPLGQWLRENQAAVKAARVAFEQRTASVSTQRSAVPEALISR